MSAVEYLDRLRREQPARRDLSTEARTFLAAGALTAVVATVFAFNEVAPERISWRDFAAVALGAALAQVFATTVGGNQTFHTGLAFAVAAGLLLPPALVVLVCLIQHVPDWLRNRYRWYVPGFNVVNYALSGIAVWAVRTSFAHGGFDLTARTSVSTVLAAAAAAAVFVVVNHALLAEMLWLAHGRGLDSSRLFGLESLITDLVLASIGVLFAFALLHEPALAPVAVVPLILIHRALVVPSLREQAFRDHKTGLLNERGFQGPAEDEFARAARFGRPLAILLCDVDDLRGINNEHGHLKGDAALVAIADAFRAELRSFDLCARFGGDEFLVLLPETTQEAALAVAERIRKWLAVHPVASHEGPVAVGVSIGAAGLTNGDTRLGDLIARGDAAMYGAKRAGRHSFVAVA